VKQKNNMSDLMTLVDSFRKTPCPFGQKHNTSMQNIRIGSGSVHSAGDILKKNGFCRPLQPDVYHASAAQTAGLI